MRKSECLLYAINDRSPSNSAMSAIGTFLPFKLSLASAEDITLLQITPVLNHVFLPLQVLISTKWRTQVGDDVTLATQYFKWQ
jgi:hypothetical protein